MYSCTPKKSRGALPQQYVWWCMSPGKSNLGLTLCVRSDKKMFSWHLSRDAEPGTLCGLLSLNDH